MSRKRFVWVLLIFSTLGGLIAVYRMLFAVWMTAYFPHGANQLWRVRFYEWFSITAADALVWCASVCWILFRKRDR
jgi:hypothetical protein